VLGLDDTGDVDPLVLVHGLATTRLIWRRVVPLLARERRVIAIDVPGFGTSPPVGEGFELEKVADAIDDGVADAGVDEHYDLAGHSMGGALALVLASRRPERVRRLVLCAPAGLTPRPALAAAAIGVVGEHLIAARRAAAPLAELAWARRLLMAGGAVDGAALPPSEVRAMVLASRGASRIAPALAAVASADLRPLLATLEVPLAAVWGARDPVIPLRTAEALRELRPDVAIEYVERAAHVAMMERPHEFTQALNAAFTAASRPSFTL
jgi:pimeloyl-ACP methyl ester carboxylesterase